MGDAEQEKLDRIYKGVMPIREKIGDWRSNRSKISPEEIRKLINIKTVIIEYLSMMRFIALEIRDADYVDRINKLTERINNIGSLNEYKIEPEAFLKIIDSFITDFDAAIDVLRGKIVMHEQAKKAA
jgi:hypothetical protein